VDRHHTDTTTIDAGGGRLARTVLDHNVVPTARDDAPPMLSTLDKGLRVLEALSRSDTGSESLTALSRAVGLHRTTVFRILGTLRARGYVSRESDTDRDRLGVRVLSLASAVLDDLDIRQVARPALQALRRETRELVFLTVLDRGEVVTVERLDSDQPLTLRAQIGSRRPAHCTAAGKAFPAALPEPEREAILHRPLPAFTPRTITLPDPLRQQLAEVCRRGFAWDDEEYLDGVRCVAAPVFGIERHVVGVVSLAVPTMRAPWDRLWRLGAEVAATARQISAGLGAPADCFGSTAIQEAS
jgi:DNA-binding IclR family transcriptional regulator